MLRELRLVIRRKPTTHHIAHLEVRSSALLHSLSLHLLQVDLLRQLRVISRGVDLFEQLRFLFSGGADLLLGRVYKS